jgi:hypothetical protein
MLYTVYRDRRWVIRILPLNGGYQYYAEQLDSGLHFRIKGYVSGWSMGTWRDALETAISEIDVRQGKPTHCELPRKVKEASNA